MNEISGEMPVRTEGDIVVARRVVREAATRQGFGLTDVTRIVTAVSELARNTLVHGGGGVMRWVATSDDKAFIELVFEDRGPGIRDIDSAMREGWSTSGGLGMGLPGARRLMDDLVLVSDPDEGTRVTVRKWLRRR